MVPSGAGILTGSIPADHVTIRGVEYFIEVAGTEYHSTFPAGNPELNPAVQRVRVAPRPLPLELSPRSYRMVSAPMELSDTSIDSVLSDYGPYGPSRWRLFRWERDAYREFPAIDASFDEATAFFLASTTGRSFTIPSGRSTDTAEPYPVRLEPGWNQIANPFAFPVHLDDVDRNSEEVRAVAFWDGREMRQDAASVNVLHPWEGYFVLNEAPNPVTIYFHPREAQVFSEGVAKSAAADRVARLSASGPRGGRDTQNWIGFTDDPRKPSKLQEAPPFGESVRLSIIEGYERYAQVLHPYDGEGGIWTIELSVVDVVLPAIIDLDVHTADAFTEAFDFVVIDSADDVQLHPENGRYVIEVTPSNPTRRLQIVAGTPSFMKRHLGYVSENPGSIQLHQNHPNPFGDGTSVRFDLDHAQEVEMEVFDVTGRRLQRLAVGRHEAGRHVVSWDGTDSGGVAVASGVYLYRLRTSSGTHSKLMTLVR